jgi:uncharacterized protein YciI
VSAGDDRPPPKAVVFYHPVPDVLDRAPAVFPRHLAAIEKFHDRGDLLLVGTFGDPAREGALCVLRSREAAEEWVRTDPFVLEGLVASYEIRDWNEILLP